MDARRVVTCAAVCGLAACGGGSSGIAPVPTRPPALSAIRVSTDSFSDPLGQHATEVEPSMAAHGLAVVAAFQIARQFVAGASAVGVARSQDGGTTWTAQSLPMLTKLTGGSADSASDPVVAYDTAHAVWLVATLPVSNGIVPAPEVSRSADGLQWDAPVRVGTGDVSDDKEWIACDGAPSSPHYGRCYVTWDDDGRGGLIETSVSSDGGVTWSAPRPSADSATGIGAQAVPRPNGDVAIVSDDFNEASVLAFVSRDGGSTWSASRRLSSIVDHFQGGGLRSGPLVSTAVDGGGTIYAVWQDCRYEAACFADDLVLATSTDGVTWSPPHRIPVGSDRERHRPFHPGSRGGPGVVGLERPACVDVLRVPACRVRRELSARRGGLDVTGRRHELDGARDAGCTDVAGVARAHDRRLDGCRLCRDRIRKGRSAFDLRVGARSIGTARRSDVCLCAAVRHASI